LQHLLCVLVRNSPRLGSLGEIYGMIVISAHGYPNGILALSNDSVHVDDTAVSPLVYVTRSDGLLGRVRSDFFQLYTRIALATQAISPIATRFTQCDLSHSVCCVFICHIILFIFQVVHELRGKTHN